MISNIPTTFHSSSIPKPFSASKTLLSPFPLFNTHVLRTNLRFKPSKLETRASSASTSNSHLVVAADSTAQEDDIASVELFEKLKDAERERVDKLEELERKANMQLERQLVLASDWSRALLTMQGKLKGTEWDPENSFMIDYSDFQRLLNSNNVQYMEYSNYGKNVAGCIFCSASYGIWNPCIQ